MPEHRPLLEIVIASTRPGRVGPCVGRWFAGRAEAHGGFAVRVVDLAEIALPFHDEPHHPRSRRYVHQHTKEWSALVEAGDAFVFVMPEYNAGLSAPMKNAVDYLSQEWQHKPVGFVSYGGVSAGTRAVQMAKQVLAAVKMVPLHEAVAIPAIRDRVDEEGRFRATEQLDRSATTLLDELRRYTEVLSALRA